MGEEQGEESLVQNPKNHTEGGEQKEKSTSAGRICPTKRGSRRLPLVIKGGGGWGMVGVPQMPSTCHKGKAGS